MQHWKVCFLLSILVTTKQRRKKSAKLFLNGDISYRIPIRLWQLRREPRGFSIIYLISGKKLTLAKFFHEKGLLWNFHIIQKTTVRDEPRSETEIFMLAQISRVKDISIDRYTWRYFERKEFKRKLFLVKFSTKSTDLSLHEIVISNSNKLASPWRKVTDCSHKLYAERRRKSCCTEIVWRVFKFWSRALLQVHELFTAAKWARNVELYRRVYFVKSRDSYK